MKTDARLEAAVRRQLADRAVLVTGASRGIGLATAELFARGGATIVICSRGRERLQEAIRRLRGHGGRVLGQAVDVADGPAVAAFAGWVGERVGPLAVLINNAGTVVSGGLLDLALDDWRQVLGVNLDGAINCCHYFVPAMVEGGRGGHVVNVSSLAGYFALGQLSSYTTSKSALIGFGAALRAELAPHRIGVSTVCPGVIDTGFTRDMRARGDLASTRARALLARIYAGRGFSPERVARAIAAAVLRRRADVFVTSEAQVLHLLQRALPRLTHRLEAVATGAIRRYGRIPEVTS